MRSARGPVSRARSGKIPCGRPPVRREYPVLAVVHVYGGAHKATELTGRPVPRRSCVLDPAVLTTEPLQPVLHTKWLPNADRFPIGFGAEFAVVGMDAFEPAISQLLFHAAAAEIQPS